MLGKSKVKYIQSLGQKKHRDEEGMFIAEGPKVVSELLHSIPQHVHEVYALSTWMKDNRELLKKVTAIEITEIELEKLTQVKTPNQVIAVIRKFESNSDIHAKGKVSLVLDAIRDPGNLGTIIRIADWFGLSQIICSNDCADIYNPKVVQATMGSIGRVKIIYTDLPEWLKQQHDSRIYGTMLEGRDVRKMNPLREGLIVIGNESNGISPEISQLINEKITIAGGGQAESLNAAVAAGIVLSHLVESR